MSDARDACDTLDPPAAPNGADAGLPPTPPTLSQDGQATQALEPLHEQHQPLLNKASTLSTPVNARSPPTPDPSPPRTASTAAHTPQPAHAPPHALAAAPERPPLFAYPSSRAESFRTAREDPFSSEPSESRSMTPVADRLRAVDEDRGLGLAFEHDDAHARPATPAPLDADTTAGAQERAADPVEDLVPDREWNTELMRNVTIRRKRKPSNSPRKRPDPPVEVVEAASPSPSPRPRRASSLRERVEASTQSPVTPSIENFAHAIGWPAEEKASPRAAPHERPRQPSEEQREERGREDSNKRNSTSSVGSTVVEAKIILTPPRRRQTLRHSGKNMAYRDEGSPTRERRYHRHSTRPASQVDDVPLHRLVHKKVNLADRTKRGSIDSDALGAERSVSTPLSFRSRMIDSSAATLRHQESVRMVLQPAADILSRSNSITRPYYADQYQPRTSSAPEPARKSALSATTKNYAHRSPPTSPRRAANVSFQTPVEEHQSPPQSPTPSFSSPRSLKRRQRSNVGDAKQASEADRVSSDPVQRTRHEHIPQDVVVNDAGHVQDKEPPAALMERVRQLVAEREAVEDTSGMPQVRQSPAIRSQPKDSRQLRQDPQRLFNHKENSPSSQQGSQSLRSQSAGSPPSSRNHKRGSLSPEFVIRPSLDRVSTEEMARRSHEWRRQSEEHGRVSFDRSTIRTEEHAGARHLYASTTPFSQFSDTPIEVSEATAVSIFPHNNHSLLVVQQVSRVNSMAPEVRQLENGEASSEHAYREYQSTPTPPFVDASESRHEDDHVQPIVTLEPSTPPMQIALPQPSAVDSPLKNPRPPPEPPKINFIPPTPAEELEKQLVPGPPKRSDSHPQRRLSLLQRARRYSDNLVPTILSRSGSNRRYTSNSHRRSHRNPHVPTVNDEDGTLHPFWRPRGFWDDFDDDSETESEDEGLHPGGDTSDVEPEPESEPPKRSNTLGRRLTSGFRGSGGFLIGNSLGVERHGTNKRRHHVTLPPHFPRSPRTSAHTASPKIIVQPPTIHDNNRITKRGSRASLHVAEGRASWRQGRSLPGLKRYQVQYIGLSGVKEKLRERGKEKRREKIRRSIGTRYYVEPGSPSASAPT